MDGTRLILSFLFLSLSVTVCRTRNTLLMQVFINAPRPIQGQSSSNVIQPFPADKTYYVVKFIPNVTMDVVHHMIVSSCHAITNITGKPTCLKSDIMYAWVKNATSFELPEGNGTERQFVHVDVYFRTPKTEIDDDAANHIGVNLLLTDTPKSKTAHTVLLMSYLGGISGNKRGFFDIACVVPTGIIIHIFAFRPHAHKLGKVISGYVVKRCSSGDCQWKLIGKKNPQNPQMVYPTVNKSLIAKPGDILAARCTMQNDDNRMVFIGPMSSNEMCNFYVMYWKTNNSQEFTGNCIKPGAPFYSWEKDKSLNNIPKDASVSQYMM